MRDDMAEWADHRPLPCARIGSGPVASRPRSHQWRSDRARSPPAINGVTPRSVNKINDHRGCIECLRIDERAFAVCTDRRGIHEKRMIRRSKALEWHERQSKPPGRRLPAVRTAVDQSHLSARLAQRGGNGAAGSAAADYGRRHAAYGQAAVREGAQHAMRVGRVGPPCTVATNQEVGGPRGHRRYAARRRLERAPPP